MKLRSQTFEFTRDILKFVNTNLKREETYRLSRTPST